jgi:hypothetical protein
VGRYFWNIKCDIKDKKNIKFRLIYNIQKMAKKNILHPKHFIRIMISIKRGVSYRELFQKFNILPLTSEFLFSLLLPVVDNMENFQANSDIHNTSYKIQT